MIAKLLCRNIIMTSKICPKTGREVFCANNAKRPMNSFESHCSHVSPFEAELKPGSFLILGVPGGVAPVWSWANKSPCLANSASTTTSGWKHWRKSEDISGNSKLGEVTWIGLLFEFHLSSTSSMSQVVCRYRAYSEKKSENTTTCDKEWMITAVHLSCILGSPNCERSNSNSTVTGEIDHAMQRRLLRWTTQNSQTAHVAGFQSKKKRCVTSFLWRLITHPFNIAASFFLPHMCCRRFAGRLRNRTNCTPCSGVPKGPKEQQSWTMEDQTGPIRAPQLHKSSVVPVVSLCAHGVGWGKIATCISGLSGTSWLFGHTVHTKPFTLWPSDRANDSNCNRSHLFRAKSDCLDCLNFVLYWTMAIEPAPIRKVKPAGTYLNLAMLIRVNSNSRSKSVWIVPLGVRDAALLIILPWSTASTPSSTDLFVTVAQDCGRRLEDTHRQIRCEGNLQHRHRSCNELYLQESAWLSIHQNHVTLPQTSCRYLHNRNANLTQNQKKESLHTLRLCILLQK